MVRDLFPEWLPPWRGCGQPSLSCPVPIWHPDHQHPPPFEQDATIQILWDRSASILQKLSYMQGHAESSGEPEVGLEY